MCGVGVRLSRMHVRLGFNPWNSQSSHEIVTNYSTLQHIIFFDKPTKNTSQIQEG